MYAQLIRQKLSTRQLALGLGLKVGRGGMLRCPFHEDSQSSLKIYRDPARGWYCFGCCRGGSVIDFAMEYYGIGFMPVVERLNRDFKLGLDLKRRLRADQLVQLSREREEEKQLRQRMLQRRAEIARQLNRAQRLCDDAMNEKEELQRMLRLKGDLPQAAAQRLAELEWSLPGLQEDCMKLQYQMEGEEEKAAGGGAAAAGQVSAEAGDAAPDAGCYAAGAGVVTATGGRRAAGAGVAAADAGRCAAKAEVVTAKAA